MLERLTLTIIIIVVCTGGLLAFRYLHIRRANRFSASMNSEQERPALLYFRSDNCAPCLTQNQYLMAIEPDFKDRFSLQKIDADIEQELSQKYGVFTLPTTLIVSRNGEVTHINYGLTATSKLTEQLEDVL